MSNRGDTTFDTTLEAATPLMIDSGRDEPATELAVTKVAAGETALSATDLSDDATRDTTARDTLLRPNLKRALSHVVPVMFLLISAAMIALVHWLSPGNFYKFNPEEFRTMQPHDRLYASVLLQARLSRAELVQNKEWIRNALLNLADYKWCSGDPLGAQPLMERAFELNEQLSYRQQHYPDESLRLALLYDEQGRTKDAVSLITAEFLGADGETHIGFDHLKGYSLAARIFSKAGMRDKADLMHKRAERCKLVSEHLSPSARVDRALDSLLELGSCYLADNDFDRARHCFRKVTDDIAASTLHRARGSVMLFATGVAEGNYKDAASELGTASTAHEWLKLNGGDGAYLESAVFLRQYGLYLKHQGQNAKAQECFDAETEIHRAHADVTGDVFSAAYEEPGG